MNHGCLGKAYVIRVYRYAFIDSCSAIGGNLNLQVVPQLFPFNAVPIVSAQLLHRYHFTINDEIVIRLRTKPFRTQHATSHMFWVLQDVSLKMFNSNTLFVRW